MVRAVSRRFENGFIVMPFEAGEHSAGKTFAMRWSAHGSKDPLILVIRYRFSSRHFSISLLVNTRTKSLGKQPFFDVVMAIFIIGAKSVR